MIGSYNAPSEPDLASSGRVAGPGLVVRIPRDQLPEHPGYPVRGKGVGSQEQSYPQQKPKNKVFKNNKSER